MVRVLVLVNEDIAKFSLVILPDLREFLQEPDSVQNNIVKIQRTSGPQLFLVGQVDAADLLQAEIPLGLGLVHEILGQLHLVLGAGDVAQDRPGREGLVVHVQFFEALLDDPQGVVCIIDRKGRWETQLFNIPPQNTHTGGVERRRPHVLGVWTDAVLQALFQFAGGFVGKGNRNNLPGRRRFQGAEQMGAGILLLGVVGRVGVVGQEIQICVLNIVRDLAGICSPAIAQEVGDAVDEHRRLPASGSGQQEQRPFRGQHAFQLAGVHPAELRGNNLPPQGGKLGLFLFRQHSYVSPSLSFWFDVLLLFYRKGTGLATGKIAPHSGVKYGIIIKTTETKTLCRRLLWIRPLPPFTSSFLT